MTNAIASAFAPDLFAGKTALVSGGGTGLGRAIAATGNPVHVDLVDIRNRDTVEAPATLPTR